MDTEDKTKKLIEKLAPIGEPTQDMAAIWGFLIQNPKDKNWWRLYLNIEFTEFIEFQRDALIHYEHLGTQVNPLGGYMVWINRAAAVYYTAAVSRIRMASYLQGPITENFVTQPAAGGAPGAPAAAGWPIAQGLQGWFRRGPMMNPASPGCSGQANCTGGQCGI